MTPTLWAIAFIPGVSSFIAFFMCICLLIDLNKAIGEINREG